MLMKDELGRRIMTEFVALRPKLYAYKTLGGSGQKKCRGVKKCITILRQLVGNALRLVPSSSIRLMTIVTLSNFVVI